MRIAVVTETYPPEVNGVALTVHSFVDHLTRLGHEILLARPRQRATQNTTPIHASMAKPAQELLVRGADLPRYPGLRFGLPAGGRLRRLWRLQRPDAVYIATEGPLGWSALRAANALGIPSATGFHTRFDDFVAHYGVGFLTPVVFSWLRRFHNRAGATLVPTHQLQQFLDDSGFERVRLLQRGVDTQLFDPARRDEALRASWGLNPDDLAVIYLGRIAPEKNLDLAIRAFDAIRLQLPRARFVWVGDGPALHQLKRERPDFVYCGVRRGTDLAGHFASCDLFLFPSLTETFGNVTVESLASGVPVVAFDYGAARELVKDRVHGRCVAMGDSEAFVAAAIELALDAPARQVMRGNAREAVARLNQANVAQQLAELLASLADRGNKPCDSPSTA